MLAWITLDGVGQAATLPPGFAESQVTAFLAGPTAMTFTPDGRLLVCEQGGRLRVVKNGGLLPTPFVTLPVDFNSERGLLGVAVDPAFDVNQYVYVYYTATTPTIHNRVSRFMASGDVAIPGSETVILELDPLISLNHNGGAINFGADGKLYVAVGDNANSANSQTLGNRLGKMLRVNPDGSIPSDNPFFNTATGANRAIWALGLRNPFNFAVQPGTGRLFINDVGENAWEEINDGIAGSNYGWPVTEGPTSDPAFRSPLHAYGHGDGSCAITGGAFYNPPHVQFPDNHVGDYFFADFCGGWIRHFDPATGAVTDFATGIDAPVDVKVASDGSLFYVSITTGALYRVQFTGSQAPFIGTHPTNQTVSVGGSATFTVGASGTPPLGYQWQRNGTDIPGATSASYTLAPVSAADNGASFRAVVSNGFGTATSNGATLTVTTNAPPSATITLPAAGAQYSAGDTISYAGTATDPEQGTLPASAFTWTVVFHHDTHTHPFLPPRSGATSGSFVIPTTGETETNVWYRIHLTVTDSSGLSHTFFRDVRPRIVTLGLATSPPRLRITLDGKPRTTPSAIPSVVGMVRTLGVDSPQTVDGATYEFVSWSDGGAATHTIVTPGTDTTHTATFRGQQNATPLFADVPADHWARQWIEALFRADVTGGCATAPLSYCPEASVTRAQMAVFLLKAADGPAFMPPACTIPPFGDVPCADLFSRWIQEMAGRNITAGCENGLYCPGNPATRQEMAVFLLRSLLGGSFTPPACVVPTFRDVPCSSPFAPWVEELVRRGITAGCAPGLYCPSDPVRRAEMAVFLVRTFQLPL